MGDRYAGDGCFFILFLIFLAVIAVGITRDVTEDRINRERDCIDAGYERAKRLAGAYHCVGVRDGNTVVEPLADVRARLEGD